MFIHYIMYSYLFHRLYKVAKGMAMALGAHR